MTKSAHDPGTYNKNTAEYEYFLNEMMGRFPEGVLLSPEYADWVQNNQLRFLIRLARYKFVAKLLKPTDQVLEVGSGSGLGSIFLGQHAFSVLGIDVKSSEVKDAIRLNQRANVEFRKADLFELEQTASYDAVVSLDVIEHLTVEDGAKLLKAQTRLLKPGGMLIIGTPSIWSYPHQSSISQASHIQCYDLPDLVELAEKYVTRTISFSMNDEVVHTGYHKMAWYYFVVGFGPKV